MAGERPGNTVPGGLCRGAGAQLPGLAEVQRGEGRGGLYRDFNVLYAVGRADIPGGFPAAVIDIAHPDDQLQPGVFQLPGNRVVHQRRLAPGGLFFSAGGPAAG